MATKNTKRHEKSELTFCVFWCFLWLRIVIVDFSADGAENVGGGADGGVDVGLGVGGGDEQGFVLAAGHVDAAVEQAPEVLGEAGGVAPAGGVPVGDGLRR